MSAKLYNSITDTIGNTPLVKLNTLAKGLYAEIFVKCEFRNPLFSVKDRIAYAMISAAEKSGELKPGSIIIEPTSGNTGIALAAIAAAKGYKCILVMPESMSLERRTLLRMLGAEVVITNKAFGMKGAIEKAESLIQENIKNAFAPRQFDNPENPKAHYTTTGPEIWEATEGNIDIFLTGIGTGGTFSGTTKFLKEKKPNIIAIAIEPEKSPFLSTGKSGAHGIQGIGAGFAPENLDRSLIDKIITVSDKDAIETAQALSAKEGIPAGISSGANVFAALQLAKQETFAGKRIVTICSSAVERYLSTPLAEKAMQEMNLLTIS